jgi:hypothetical protein
MGDEDKRSEYDRSVQALLSAKVRRRDLIIRKYRPDLDGTIALVQALLDFPLVRVVDRFSRPLRRLSQRLCSLRSDLQALDREERDEGLHAADATMLSKADAERLARELENPSEPNAALRALMQRNRASPKAEE